jgi:hypothetical protein
MYYSFPGEVGEGQGAFDFHDDESLEGKAKSEDETPKLKPRTPRKKRPLKLDTLFDYRRFGEEVSRRNINIRDRFSHTSAKAELLMKYGVPRLVVSKGESVPTTGARPERIGSAFERYYEGYLARKEQCGW